MLYCDATSLHFSSGVAAYVAMQSEVVLLIVAARLSVEVWVISLVVLVNWRGKWSTRRKGLARAEDVRREERRNCGLPISRHPDKQS